MEAIAYQDHRQYPRISCDIPATLFTKCGDIPIEISGRMINYSLGGYGFQAQHTYCTIGDTRIEMSRGYRPHKKDMADLVVNDIKQIVNVRWSNREITGMSIVE